MSWINDISEALKNLADLEKVGIFCFMIISIFLILSKINFAIGLILESFGIILLFLHAGLHKIKEETSFPDANNKNRIITRQQIGYDFSSVLNKKHPYNSIRKISFFFITLGTLSLIIEYLLKLKN